MKAASLALRTIIVLLAAVLVFTTGGCGGGGGGSSSPVSLGGPTTSSSGSTSQFVGTAVCTGCHTSFPYSNGFQPGDLSDTNTASPTYYDTAANGNIPANYTASVHYATPTVKSVARDTGTDVVTCEGCHGPGAQHYGVGPMPSNRPGIAQCEACHNGTSIRAAAVINLTEFNKTAHANPTSTPDQFFFQGGVGATQASLFNSPEWADANRTVPVSKNQHIEECSVCHSTTNEASQIANGNVANPPQVACNACHDPHRPADTQRNWVSARDGSGLASVAPENVINMKPVKVNNNAAAAQFGAQNTASGTWIRPRMWYPYYQGGNQANTRATYLQVQMYTSGTSVYAYQGTWGTDDLRLSPERLCAGCHTKGQYKYGVATSSTTLPSTHNTDVFTQYLKSGHGDKTQPAWEEFSLMGPATGVSHRPCYPIDMGGLPGENGNTKALNGALNPLAQGKAQPFACFQCHNGIGTIAYLEGTVGSVGLGDRATVGDAPIVWGDTNITCITCHDTHQNGSSTTKNVRVPKYMSYNGEFKPSRTANGGGNWRGAVNKFLDLSDLPTNAGNNVICIFCHQGRESGWTSWNKVRINVAKSAANSSTFVYDNWNTPITTANGYTSNQSVTNDHYLAAASLLWGRNANEFNTDATGNTGNTAYYTNGIPDHQTKGCTGCHMAEAKADNSEGGHTWKVKIETCNECHKGITDFHAVAASANWAGLAATGTVFDQIGTIAVIPKNTPLADVLAPGYAGGGTGLFGQLNRVLYAKKFGTQVSGPRFYPPGASGGQYVATMTSDTTSYSGVTPAQLWAAQNLCSMYKSGGADPVTALSQTQAVYVHNPYYAVQVLLDCLAKLGQTTNLDTGTPFVRPNWGPTQGTYNSGGTSHAGRYYPNLTP